LVAATSAVLASLYFLIIGLVAPDASPVPLEMVFLLSLMPAVIATAVAVRGDVRFDWAGKAATASVGSLFLFVILLGVYLALAM
jgi:hypothetical protein